MDQQLTMLIKMRDELSKPLTDQQKALKAVSGQIKDLQKVQRDAGQEQKKYAKECVELGEALDTAVVAGAVAAAAAIVAFGGALVYATAKLVEFSTAQSAAGEKLTASYTMWTKNAAGAERARDMVDELANRMHVAPDKLHANAQELLQSGIKNQAELQNSLRAVANLQKTGNEGAANKLKGLFEKNAETRRQFGGAGRFAISRAEAEEVLGAGGFAQLQEAIKRKGGNVDQTMANAYGQLYTTADIGNKALADVINNGKVGDAAKRMLGGFPELITHATTVIRQLFQDIGKTEGFKEFILSMHQLIDVFEVIGKGGTKSGIANTMGAGFHLLSMGVQKVITGMLYLRIYTLRFATTMLLAALATKQWFAVGDRLDWLKGALIGVGIVMLLVLATVVLLAAAFAVLWIVIMLPIFIIIGLFILLGVAIVKITKNFAGWKEKAKQAVVDLITGLVSGIQNGIRKVVDASKDLGNGVLDGVKHALDSHSPSRKLMQEGINAGLGFQQGLDRVGTFTMGAIQGPLAMGGGGGGGGMGGGQFTWTGDVVVQGSTNMGADELRPLIESAVADAFEKFAIEFGGPNYG